MKSNPEKATYCERQITGGSDKNLRHRSRFYDASIYLVGVLFEVKQCANAPIAHFLIRLSL